ncbi:MAG: response regulator transcription factor [Candidatus Zixiibacteriota bacterium]
MSLDILIAEDDRKIAELVAKNLQAAGFTCRQVHDGLTALQEIQKNRPRLLVVDVMMPHMDGIELTRQVRRTSDMPILMLTARSSESDKVLGFEIGADDYLTKPFSTLELVARVRALIRRTVPGGRQEPLTRGPLTIDPSRRTVVRDGETIDLTSLEFDLLYFMATHAGRVYSREALMEQVWGEDRVVDPRSIDSLVSRLRKHLESDPARPRFIQTVWGAGYRFTDSEE